MKGKDPQNFMIRIVEAFRNLPLTNNLSLSKAVYNFFPPIIPHRIHEPLNPTRVTGQPISSDAETLNLASESTRLYAERRALCERRQAIPDAVTELGLNEDQLCNLKACVNRCFLVGYDCSKPMDVKPVRSFIHDPCEPI